MHVCMCLYNVHATRPLSPARTHPAPKVGPYFWALVGINAVTMAVFPAMATRSAAL